MKIRYTEHALFRLYERHIPKEKVIEAFFNGNKYDSNGGLRRCEWQELVLICKILGEDEIKIITVYERNNENHI